MKRKGKKNLSYIPIDILFSMIYYLIGRILMTVERKLLSVLPKVICQIIAKKANKRLHKCIYILLVVPSTFGLYRSSCVARPPRDSICQLVSRTLI